MAMAKGIEKVVGCEGFDVNVLREAIKKVNESGILESPLKFVGKTKEVMIDSFFKAIESVPEGSDLEKKIPPEAVKLYNEYVEVMEDKRIVLEKMEGEGKIRKTGDSSGKKDKEKAIGKNQAFCDAMKKGGTKEEITKEAERIYCEERGISVEIKCPKMSFWVADALLILERLNLVKNDNGKLSI